MVFIQVISLTKVAKFIPHRWTVDRKRLDMNRIAHTVEKTADNPHRKKKRNVIFFYNPSLAFPFMREELKKLVERFAR